ncbi:MAG: dTMP kinase [Brevinematia bacterium]
MVIVFEGIDGSGKTTISNMIFNEISQVFPGEVFWFSEPSPTELGKHLKDILTLERFKLSIPEQLLLFTADRMWLLRNYVIPYSRENKIILMDRSFVSTYAYQVMNVEDEETCRILVDLTEHSIRDFYIDILFYLDCPSEISLGRIKVKDGIESRGVDFIEKVRRNYLAFLQTPHEHIRKVVVINATEDLENVYQKVRGVILDHIGYIT